MTLVPRVDQAIQPGDMESWDFCLRKIYVLKGQPLRKAIQSLGHGADALNLSLSSPSTPADLRVDVDKRVSDLTVEEWGKVINVFKAWPFKPETAYVADPFTDELGRKLLSNSQT